MIGAVLAAGSATASEVALKGGMSLIDGTFITAIFTGMAAVISAIGTLLYCNRRAAKNVKLVPQYVTCEECEKHRAAITKRVDELGPALNRIFVQIRENDKKSEERAMQMHRRIDPLIEKVAANSAVIETMKEAKK